MKVEEAVPDFADAFGFDSFNAMQREVLPAVLETEENVVACAPTASGKTAVAELAICETLRGGGTALFVAPLRALTSEKEREWERFEALGYSVYVVSGERDLDPGRAERADVIVTTPEKADSATRKHDSPRYSFITDVNTVIIDEVHLLDAESRGGVLEAVVSRLRRLAAPRFVALSAAVSNVSDVADWLSAPAETTFDFDDDYRPVDLAASVETYSRGENSFADKYRRLYRALDLAEPHLRSDGQALVFVASRSDTVEAARKARDVLASRDVPVGARGDYDFHTDAKELENDDLRKSVVDGVAFHHAGLSRADRERVEAWFREGQVEVLFSTSTLAWGVNLPARCVVVRDTTRHDPLEGEVPVSPVDVLQMLGRAGRPGYDDVGYGHVVCAPDEADRYRDLLSAGVEVESRLAADLDAHLNAEIATGTVDDLDDVLSWLETTYYAVRATRRGDDLRARARETVESLVERGFVAFDDEHDLRVAPTPLGELASDYYLRLDTAARFRDTAGRPALSVTDVLETVAGAAEFRSAAARADEADAVDAVLAGVETDLDGGQRKVLAVLHAATTGSTPEALRSDAWLIRRNGARLCAAFRAVLDRFAAPRHANVARRAEARVEHGVSADAVGVTAVGGVGTERARSLARAGHRCPADLVDAGRAGLTPVVGEGVAERIVDAAADLPAVEIDLSALPNSVAPGERAFTPAVVRNSAGTARIRLRATVEGREMTARTVRLGGRTELPVGVFGAPESDELTYRVEAWMPDYPIPPVVAEHTVRVE